ncbi:3-hydroxyacyl-CoA dehydrogenase family protein [Nocardia vermiculata]|uniref:3-hydroxyacyl-CoA dehydrogenase family protein n=1 Tax=Nocardia vermiculata TaxID=257274 RepID=A0A846Y0B3_9NOCA|nr:3-hydroxyacyl-CoA dehydrogenase family protein [Nocardia vermiculata]NKY52287.1 3-hydroxyacyl-CoA dehydrogenase family protein [Nocardia vermiculata]
MSAFPTRTAVIGGGRMGIGIAHVFAAAGATVTVCEAGDLDAARQRLARSLARAEERGKLGDTVEVVTARVSFVSEVNRIGADVELLVEAVPEVMALKLEVLAAAERILPETAVLATNTSSLSVGEMAAALERPGRFLGTHFFNPVPASALVEIVRPVDVTDEGVNAVTAWVRTLGKEPVVVRDSPGFATSRLGVLLGLEAIRMVEEDVADAESIDKAMELGYRHPMGPLRSTDLVGLDVRLAVADYLRSTLGERFAAPQLLRDKVERGELGRKTGHGFYGW